MTALSPENAVPITDEARNGRYQFLLSDTGHFALVRWDGNGWVFGSGQPLHFEATVFVPRGRADG